ncbi:MAG: peroxide stress protein YaaA, partial [Gammaproteobacteria bacterium]|nr:peroxide stress protein YaaA [Gammaproteobacteria bacterium]
MVGRARFCAHAVVYNSASTVVSINEKIMLITLSPSKGQDFEETSLSKKYSKPVDLKDSELLIKELRKINSKQLQELMAVSENIAKLNVERYKSFITPFTTKNAKQAVFAFKGDVYS